MTGANPNDPRGILRIDHDGMSFAKPDLGELSHNLVLIAPLTRGLYGMGSDLSSMEQGGLCRDRCMGLLLAEYMQDIGAARLDAETLPYLCHSFHSCLRPAHMFVEAICGSDHTAESYKKQLRFGITPNMQDMRSKFGYTALNKISNYHYPNIFH